MTVSIQEVRAEIRRVLEAMAARCAQHADEGRDAVMIVGDVVHAGLRALIKAIEQAPPPEPAAVCPKCSGKGRYLFDSGWRYTCECQNKNEPAAVSDPQYAMACDPNSYPKFPTMVDRYEQTTPGGLDPSVGTTARNEPAPVAPVGDICANCWDHVTDVALIADGTCRTCDTKWVEGRRAAPRPPSCDLSELRAALAVMEREMKNISADWHARHADGDGIYWNSKPKRVAFGTLPMETIVQAWPKLRGLIERHIAAAQAEQGEM